jgi:hypothetical protein
MSASEEVLIAMKMQTELDCYRAALEKIRDNEAWYPSDAEWASDLKHIAWVALKEGPTLGATTSD